VPLSRAAALRKIDGKMSQNIVSIAIVDPFEAASRKVFEDTIWKANVDGGVEVIKAKKKEVEDIKVTHKRTIDKWNEKYPNDKVSDSLKIIAGKGEGTWVLTMEEGNEVFAVTPSDRQRNIYDARWIKLYHGGNPYYQVNQEDKNTKPRREVHRVYKYTDKNGKLKEEYYVEKVCSKN
jgi:hypothetical protein